MADVFDALTSHRPYKREWTVAEAFAELDLMAGNGKLDPRCVDAMKAARSEVEGVLVQHPEHGPSIQTGS